MVSRALAPPLRSAAAISRAGSDRWRVLAVTVEDGGDVAGPTGAAGAALAELGARLGVDADLGHGGVLLKGGSGLRAGEARGTLLTETHVDHGAATAPSPGSHEYDPAKARLTGVPRASGGCTNALQHRGRPRESRSAGAVEQAGHRTVLEDLADRAGDQRGDRQHGELVELPLGRDRQRVGDDDLADLGCSSAGRRPGRTGRRGWRPR